MEDEGEATELGGRADGEGEERTQVGGEERENGQEDM